MAWFWGEISGDRENEKLGMKKRLENQFENLEFWDSVSKIILII
jgi:hypothetical protein